MTHAARRRGEVEHGAGAGLADNVTAGEGQGYVGWSGAGSAAVNGSSQHGHVNKGMPAVLRMVCDDGLEKAAAAVGEALLRSDMWAKCVSTSSRWMSSYPRQETP